MAADDRAEALLESLIAVGVVAGGDVDGPSVDVVLPGGPVRLSTVSLSEARGEPGEVVVADRIVAADRARLDGMGVAWLDRRGHLKLCHGTTWIDTAVPAIGVARVRDRVDPLAGAVVSAVALEALVAWPDPLPGVRALARVAGASPGGVSLAVRRLVDAGLLTRDRRAAVPGLFWAVVDAWRPRWTALASPPPLGSAAVLVGDRAGAVLGAPVGGTDPAVEVLVADPAELRRMVRRSGAATSPAEAVARVALAPAPVAAERGAGGVEEQGLAVGHPVVVALSLAGDTARGAEIVRGWELDARPW